MFVLKSRRFWTFIVGQILTMTTFIFSHYVSVDPALVTMIVTFVEGLSAILITAFTVDDITSNVTAIKMGTHPDYPAK